MRLLYDASLPQSLSAEAPEWVSLDRWEEGDKNDVEIIQATASRGYRGFVFLGRDSLFQLGVREAAEERGVALVAVDARDPIEAKQRILNNLSNLQSALAGHDCVLIMASSVRLL